MATRTNQDRTNQDRSDEAHPTGTSVDEGDVSDRGHDEGQDQGRDERRMYLRFGAMIATSTVVMFLLTYTNSYTFDHVRWSEERVYMALLMGGAMAIVMLGFMWGMMYKNTRWNIAVVAAGLVLAGAALFLSRSQFFVDDREYMKGMIPHHSIAILTSERADIDDLRVRELADEIIVAQREEIDEMDWLIDDIAENGPATTPEEAEARPVPEFEASP
jgi:hypothetical protein